MSINFSNRPNIELAGNYPIPLIPSHLDLIPFDRLSTCSDTILRLPTSTSEFEIHYTTDGSDPDKESPIYQDSILIKRSCLLKLRAFDPYGGGFSRIDSAFISKKRPGQGMKFNYILFPPDIDIQNIWDNLSQYPILISDITRDWNPELKEYRNHHFVIDYQGVIQIPETGNYQFSFNNAQYIRLTIDGTTYFPDSNTPISADLTSGKHQISITYVHEQGFPQWSCHLQGPNFKKQPLPIEWISYQ